MVKFETLRFGLLKVKEDGIITFPEGILGFPAVKRYVLIDHKGTILRWLQAVDNPDIAFIVVEPKTVSSEYTMKIDAFAREFLQIESEKDLIVLVIIRVDNGKIAANLHGPLLINTNNMKGIQLILERVLPPAS